jgi:hypothetical protein
VFLNGNGNAMADGRPMPVRFGTWYWALGIAKAAFVPSKLGANYDMKPEMEALKPVQQHFNVLTNYTAFRDNAPNLCHFSGWVICRTGSAPMTSGNIPGETVDVTIANQIGRTTRYKMLTASADGNARDTFSYDNPTTPNASEVSGLKFYTRLFGPDFQDPNAPTFTPSPKVMVRKSAISGVLDDVKDLNKVVGADDKARLDQYFTDVVGLAAALHDHPGLTSCLVKRVYAYGTGSQTTNDDAEMLKFLNARFEAAGYRVPDLLRTIALSNSFSEFKEAAPATDEAKTASAQPTTK